MSADSSRACFLTFTGEGNPAGRGRLGGSESKNRGSKESILEVEFGCVSRKLHTNYGVGRVCGGWPNTIDDAAGQLRNSVY